MFIDKQIATFISEMGETPLLTADQEKELALIIRANKSEKKKNAAVEKMVKANLRLVLKEAFKQSSKTGLDVKDLIGHGCLGLMKAVFNFDPDVGTKFSTYAVLWIQQGMRDYMYKNTNPVQIPIHIINGLSKHKRLMDANGQYGKTDEEIMEELHINESFLKRVKKAYISSVSLDQTQSSNVGAGDEGRSFEETIPDENAVDPSMAVENTDSYKDLYAAMEELDPMSREIVTAQFLENDKVQLSKLGDKYGVTGERIRQIKVKALKLLKKKLHRRAKFGK